MRCFRRAPARFLHSVSDSSPASCSRLSARPSFSPSAPKPLSDCASSGAHEHRRALSRCTNARDPTRWDEEEAAAHVASTSPGAFARCASTPSSGFSALALHSSFPPSPSFSPVNFGCFLKTQEDVVQSASRRSRLAPPAPLRFFSSAPRPHQAPRKDDPPDVKRRGQGGAGALLLRLKWHSNFYSAGPSAAQMHPQSLLASPSGAASAGSARAREREEEREALLRETYLCLPQLKANEAAEAAYLIATMYEAGAGGEEKGDVPIELLKALLVQVLRQDPARTLAPVALHRFLRVSALYPHAADRGLLEDLALTLARRHRHLSVTSLQLITEDFSSCFFPGFHPLFAAIADHLTAPPSARPRTPSERDADERKGRRDAASGSVRRGGVERGDTWVSEKEEDLTATHACFFFNSYSRTNCHPPHFFERLSRVLEESLEALHRAQFSQARSAPSAPAAPSFASASSSSVPDRFSFSILALGLKGMVNCGVQPSEKFVRLAGDLVTNYIDDPEASVLHQRGEKLATKSLLRALTFFCKARTASLVAELSAPPASPADALCAAPSPCSVSFPLFHVASCLADKLPPHAFCSDDLADLSTAVRCLDALLLSACPASHSLALLLQDFCSGAEDEAFQTLRGERGTNPSGRSGDASGASPSAHETGGAAHALDAANLPLSSASSSPSPAAPPAAFAPLAGAVSGGSSPASLRPWLALYVRLQARFLSLLKLHLSNLHPFQRISVLDQMLATSSLFPPEARREPKHAALLCALRSLGHAEAVTPEGTRSAGEGAAGAEDLAPTQSARPPAGAAAVAGGRGDAAVSGHGAAGSPLEPPPSGSALSAPSSSEAAAPRSPPVLSPAIVSLLRSIYYRLASLNLRLLSLLLASLHAVHFSFQGPTPPTRTQQLCAPHKKDVHWSNAFLHILGREGMRKVGTATPEEMAEFLLRYYVDLECFDVCIEPLTFYVEKLAMLHQLRQLAPAVLDALAVTLQAALATPHGLPALQDLPDGARTFADHVSRRTVSV
ncbi:hypothetical protein BESB_019270 [Besnoitia besnoiti]|uniref:Uncharacterized protein n=1 Tax=Besnoitia besnoiti TaxID=94643 RepID=A0A2A9M7V8_BESBE|nr:hypothetical protein BESB_019270 [Besnoitia besnoiti]PFH31986.1 hypothetical protein BESB_019270 [Besnoitia besnoiti]